MPIFEHNIGIDYSGAETPTSIMQGPRVYLAGHVILPTEVKSPLNIMDKMK